MALKPGFFSHHTAACDIEFRGVHGAKDGDPVKSYWCNTHGQWCYERPVKTVWTFADDTTIEEVRGKDD